MSSNVFGNASKKKKGIIVGLLSFVAIFLLAALVCLILFIINFLIPDRSETERMNITFAEVDYSYDITEDDKYMVEDRRVWVDDGALSAPIDDEDYSDNQLYLFVNLFLLDKVEILALDNLSVFVHLKIILVAYVN